VTAESQRTAFSEVSYFSVAKNIFTGRSVFPSINEMMNELNSGIGKRFLLVIATDQLCRVGRRAVGRAGG